MTVKGKEILFFFAPNRSPLLKSQMVDTQFYLLHT